jgi:hypothetical protein
MSTSLPVEMTLGHCCARARCLVSSWSEKAELRRVNEHAVQLWDLCWVSGAKRRSCTNTERTHRAAREHTRKPDVGAAGGLYAGIACASNMCAVKTRDNTQCIWLLWFVGLCSEILVRRKQLASRRERVDGAIRGRDCARTIHTLTQRRRHSAGLSWRFLCLYLRCCLRQTRGKPASSEQSEA